MHHDQLIQPDTWTFKLRTRREAIDQGTLILGVFQKEDVLFLLMFALPHCSHSILVLQYYFFLSIWHLNNWCFLPLILGKRSRGNQSRLCAYWKGEGIYSYWETRLPHPCSLLATRNLLSASSSPLWVHRHWSGASAIMFKQFFWKAKALDVLSRGSDLVPTAMSESRPILLALNCKQFSGSTQSSACQNELRKRFWQVLLD